MKPTLVITRPVDLAKEFATAVNRNFNGGISTVFSPAYEIKYSHNVPEKRTYKHLLFTSGNGVEAARKLNLKAEAEVWCVGDSTARKAALAGYSSLSAGGNAENLISLVKNEYVSGEILHVSGTITQVNVSQALQNLGIPCYNFAAYDQEMLTPRHELKIALEGSAPVVLPLFSTRATMILKGMKVNAPLHFVSISQNVSDEISNLFDATYIVADAPNRASMVEATCGVLLRLLNLESNADLG